MKPISYGISGACKGSTEELNLIGCDNTPTHLQNRVFGGLREGTRPEAMLVAWCCSCYRLEGGEDCNYEAEELEVSA